MATLEEELEKGFNEVKKKVTTVVKENELDKKAIVAKDKVVEISKEVEKNINAFVKEKEIDKKIDDVSNSVINAFKGTKKGE